MELTTKTEKIFELSAPYDNKYQGDTPRVLFVCSAGLLRSPTGAMVGSKYFNLNTRACGTEEYALIPLSINLINWAHRIFFLEQDNYIKTVETFKYFLDEETNLEIKSVVLDIPDVYNYGEYKLVESFILKLKSYYAMDKEWADTLKRSDLSEYYKNPRP